ncbi:unnamed protein product [Knipowitschia caucasica]
MATKRLAKELGLLRQRSSSSSGSKKLVSNQIFAYIVVIDFESTCWKEKNNYGQEIIEFPAVLLNTSTGEVEREFHSYVQPQEHPILSSFCTELTGISQSQVEAGVPLQICLSRFSRWLQTLQQQKGLEFPNRQPSTEASNTSTLCTFLTWSDWDLGVCLQYECKRKQINKPHMLNSWIDLRSTYRLFYNRKPKGLNGALQDLGIQFEGREHSGLDDARNTAQLAARMTRDGCVLRLTRCLDPMPITAKVKSLAEARKPSIQKENDHGTPIISEPSTSTAIFQKPGSNHLPAAVNPTTIQSLVLPKTVLNGTTIVRQTLSNLSSVTVYTPSTNFTSKIANSDQDLPHLQQSPVKGSVVQFVAESEERCGSYDDVVLEDIESEEFESASNYSEEHVYLPRPCSDANTSVHGHQENSLKHPIETHFAVPKPVGECKVVPTKKFNLSTLQINSTMNFPANTGNTLKPGIEENVPVLKAVGNQKCSQKKKWASHCLLNKSELSLSRNLLMPQVLVPNTQMFHKPAPKSFSIYTDTGDSSYSTISRPSTSKSILSNVSVNTSLNRTLGAKGGCRITSPLCECGRRAKRQTVSNGGPNQGRAFFCCPGKRNDKRCGFFKWESAVVKNSVAASRTSVSMHHMSTSVNNQQQSLRKSL